MLGTLDARLDLVVLWGARGDLERLLDARHAALEDDWKRWMEGRGWVVRAEVSFNRYGDRGVIDLLGLHPPSGTLVVTEIKTAIYDLQQLLGALDVKRRMARQVAASLGWNGGRVVACLLLADDTTARRRVAEHPALFASFRRRGREAHTWLRAPAEPAMDLLIFRKLPDSKETRLRQVGRRRVRPGRLPPSVDPGGDPGASPQPST